MIKNLAKNNSGDTIIEVLISLVIVAFIITGAYVTSHDSLSNIVAARERIQALGIAQSQVEDLRAESKQLTSIAYTSPTGFCFTPSGTMLTITVFTAASCTINNGYITKIVDQGPTDTTASDHITTDTFIITVNWQSVSKNSTGVGAQLSLFYRVTPG